MIEPEIQQPHVYDSPSSKWIALDKSLPGTLRTGHILKAVSWILHGLGPDPAGRALAALEHLRHLFGDAPSHHVFLFQEVRLESLQIILKDEWAQRNFALSDVCPPPPLYTDVRGESFFARIFKWKASLLFTLIMTSRDLGVVDCFRVPFDSKIGRDALVVDVPVGDNSARIDGTLESVRICSIHFESRRNNAALRTSRLATVSRLLKGTIVLNSRPVAGIVGGDMNHERGWEHSIHGAAEIDLRDAWVKRCILEGNETNTDSSYGRAACKTYGYHAQDCGKGLKERRFDKFFYTGKLETVALNGMEDFAGKVGRFGIGLATEVEAWQMGSIEERRDGTLPETNFKTVYVADHMLEWMQATKKLSPSDISKLVRTKVTTLVSDHFGIAVGFKLLPAGKSTDSTCNHENTPRLLTPISYSDANKLAPPKDAPQAQHPSLYRPDYFLTSPGGRPNHSIRR